MKKKTKERIAQLEVALSVATAEARELHKRLLTLEHALAFNFFAMAALAKSGDVDNNKMNNVVQAIARRQRLDIDIINHGNGNNIRLEMDIRPHDRSRFS